MDMTGPNSISLVLFELIFMKFNCDHAATWFSASCICMAVSVRGDDFIVDEFIRILDGTQVIYQHDEEDVGTKPGALTHSTGERLPFREGRPNLNSLLTV